MSDTRSSIHWTECCRLYDIDGNNFGDPTQAVRIMWVKDDLARVNWDKMGTYMSENTILKQFHLDLGSSVLVVIVFCYLLYLVMGYHLRYPKQSYHL